MADAFIHICKHVLRQPNMNTDLTKFVPEFELYDMDDDDWIFYTRFLRSFMYKLHESKPYESEKTKNLFLYRNRSMKFQGYIDMHTDRPPLFYEGNLGQAYDKDDNSFNAVLNRRNPKVVSQGTIDLYVTCQKHYHSLIKFVNIVKMRYANAKNQFDLLLRPIHENDKNVYVILQGNIKYLFRVSEFQQIIVTCIGNTSDYFPEMLEIKNPYNNMRITDNILYNFYFYLKTNNYKIDELFNAYFNSNLSTTNYVLKYEVIIRDRAITEEVKHGHHDNLYPYVLRMFLEYKRYIGNIHISCGFPRKKLVDIMRPYLQLYMYHIYYPRELPRKYQSEELLEKRLKQLSCINPLFGQRTVTNEGSTHGNSVCVARYNCLVPGFYKPVCYSNGKDEYFTVEDDIQYRKMIAYFKSFDLSLVKHTDFHSSDMEEEYEFYIDKYYRRQKVRLRSRTFVGGDDETEESDEEKEESDEEKEESDEEKEEDDTISGSSDTVVDSDDELERTVSNDDTHLTELLTRLNTVLTPLRDTIDNNNDPEPRLVTPVPHQSYEIETRMEYPINTVRGPLTYAMRPTQYMLTPSQLVSETQYNNISHSEIMNHHEEVMERVLTTFNEVSQRLNSITSPINTTTINHDDSSCDMSICDPIDDEHETNSVVVGATIENLTQCSEEDNSDMSIETDPDVNVIANNMSSQPKNEEMKGKYIVRAMTGSRETGYTIELAETFYTAEVANNFYENIALNYYNLKEIEFVPIELLTSNEAQHAKSIISYEENNKYDPSKYTNNGETTETFETTNVLDMFLCDNCNLRSIKNKCYVCNREDVCNYCNGDNVWCKQNEDWMCRDCHNNRLQEEYNEEEAENEEEIVSSSLMTYGIPANADMTPEEYMNSRMEEMTRDAYLERGFTEEDYDEMQDLRLEEYGSDGEHEDY